jgi:Ca2+-binding RTX toxin-like protein
MHHREAEDDSLVGGTANETLEGGSATDTLVGEGGDDTYAFTRSGSENLGSDTVTEAADADRELFDRSCLGAAAMGQM